MKKVDELPILERIKDIIPPVDELAAAMKAEHTKADRIRRATLIAHASLVDLFEQINQIMTEAGDIVNAQSALASSQRADMDMMEQLADRNAGARTVVQNQDVWFRSDPVSIAHILQIVDLPQLTEAARHLERDRVFALIDALQKAVE